MCTVQSKSNLKTRQTTHLIALNHSAEILHSLGPFCTMLSIVFMQKQKENIASTD